MAERTTAGRTNVTRLFFSTRGRVARGSWVLGTTAVLVTFAASFVVVERVGGRAATLALYPVLYWCVLALAIKRCHDIGRSGARLLLLLLPLLGPLWILFELSFRRGTTGENGFGPQPRYHGLDHHVVAMTREDRGDRHVVNDITGINPIEVAAIVVPVSREEVQDAIRRSSGAVSIGGGRFSMGGQIASPGSVHLDLRRLNQVVSVSPLHRTIRVQAGIRWCDVQRVLDAHGLAVKVMQTYANFTVGGSLSVNVHGRYVGLGPIILSVRAITLVLADGSLVEATATESSEIFFGAIGGYGGLGVIVEAELEVVDNVRLERVTQKLRAARYPEYFRQKVRSQPKAVLHNADLYPPRFERMRSVTWLETEKFVTQPLRLRRAEPSHKLARYSFWAFSETPFGKWRREFVFETLIYLGQVVHWRNYEAGYDVAELEPATRRWKTYVLQEYFVPVERFSEFVVGMAEIFRRYRVNVINVSVRHAQRDAGSLLAWAREEVFAFVVYYKQGVSEAARNEVATWTRELIEWTLTCGGTWYLPYQLHATPEQFHRGYPRARELFALKARIDPALRFRNSLWDRYYPPAMADGAPVKPAPASEFHAVFDETVWRDRFYLFLQNIYGLFPERRFHWLIRQACQHLQDDEAIYRHVQEGLPGITPFAAPLFYALPALGRQKGEMTSQTLELLGDQRVVRGYLEIGSVGRYLSTLRKAVRIEAPLFVVNDVAPGMSPVDVAERGQIRRLGTFVPLDDYAPLPVGMIADASLDLVTCYIGLHHAPREKLDPFVRSIHRVLRPGGRFIVRDHDVTTPEMRTFVSLVHSVFNAGTGVPWPVDRKELRFFTSVDETVRQVETCGFRDSGARLRQRNDPTLNTLLGFVKA